MGSRRSVFRELLPLPGVLETFESVLRLPYPILFDSATAVSPVARHSFVAADPRVVVRAKGYTVELIDPRAGTFVQREGKALDFVTQLLHTMRQEQDDSDDQEQLPSGMNLKELPPFQGGAAGYVGYEYGTLLEQLPRPKIDDITIPDVVMGIYDWVIAWDHAAGRAWVIGNNEHEVDTVIQLLKDHSVSETEGEQSDTYKDMGRTNPAFFHVQPMLSQYESTFTPTSYNAAVQQVRDYIVAGEIFQANLSQRFSASLPHYWDRPTIGTSSKPTTAAWALYRRIRAINPSPFASYFDFGDGVVVSASPERFLLASADGKVETRPIKGTRPRAPEAAMDETAKDELMNSEKDTAEHVMIVDVLRNDLSRVCLSGSVNVPALLSHERHPTVHHLVSTIVGQLRPDTNCIDLIHACFPGGSITGAPKIRAMEIIAQLEPVTRGIYCGTIGYFSVTGAMDTNILIRTYLVKDKQVYFSAGGGIVADSDPAAEYEETLVKAYALMQAIHT